MVPPCSDRVSRAPPYSRTNELPYPYRAVTVSGAPFQALPVRAHWPLAWSAFARHYSRSLSLPARRPKDLLLMSFPPATEMVQFAGFASSSYGFTAGYPKRGGLPHSDISGSTVARTSPELFAACHVLHRLSVPRHPPDALTSRSPTPSPKHACAENRGQTTEDRPDVAARSTDVPPETPFCSLFSVTCSLEPGASRQGLRLGVRIPMPGSGQDGTWPDPLHGFHDSLHDVREQRAENREQTRRGRSRALCKLEEAGVRGRRSHLPLL